jgi:phage-related protein
MRAFPRDARQLAGVQLRRVQQDLEPFDWKPMALVGPSVREIRVHTALEHRVLYVAKFAEAVYVLHVFEKRSRKTPQRDVSLARQRFRELLALRRARKGPGG